MYNIYDRTVMVSKSRCIVGYLDCNSKASNYVVIKHSYIGYICSYMYLDSVFVSVGDKLIAGDVIGTMGNTGNVIPSPNAPNSKLGIYLYFTLQKGQEYNSSNLVNSINLFLN